jgi:hypothetical protein
MSSEDTVAVRLDNIFLYMVRRAGKVRRAYYEIQASIAVEISAMEAENALVDEKLFSRWVVANVDGKSRIICDEIEKVITSNLGLTEGIKRARFLRALIGAERREGFSKYLGQLGEDLAEMRATLV